MGGLIPWNKWNMAQTKSQVQFGPNQRNLLVPSGGKLEELEATLNAPSIALVVKPKSWGVISWVF